MNILFVAKAYDQTAGGIETQMQLVATELANRHRVAVATALPHAGRAADPRIAMHGFVLGGLDRWRMRPLRLLPARHRKHTSWLGYRFFRSAYLPRMRRIVREMDVVHAMKAGHMSWIAEEAARLERVPFVITPYVHPHAGGELSPKEFDRARLYTRAAAVLALLETDKRILMQLGVPEDRLRLIGVVPLLPAATDPASFRARHGFGDDPVILFVGRIVAYKGPAALLEAAPSVWERFPNARFVFAGPTDSSASKLFEGRDRRVQYLGFIDQQEKGDAMAACDIFAMPSAAEILPAVYLEAWSCGKPVIGGSAHGLTELIEGNGAGVTAGQDPAELAGRIVDLLGDEACRRQMGERGRALVRRRFSKEALVRTLEETYGGAGKAAKQDPAIAQAAPVAVNRHRTAAEPGP